MSRMFIRALWGIHDHQNRRFYTRRTKLDNDIALLQHAKYNEPFIVYVFGAENAEYMKQLGFDYRLLDPEPIKWDMDTQQFRHKLEVLKVAMDEFDEIVFLDWDELPIKPLPPNFWETLKKKSDIQCILRYYHRSKAWWRNTDWRKVPCGSFIYIGDKTIPHKLLDLWENTLNKCWSEEVVIAKYMDDISGGWKGIEYYWDHFEPEFFVLTQGRVYSSDLLKTKNPCFDHFNKHDVDRELRSISAGKLKDWQK